MATLLRGNPDANIICREVITTVIANTIDILSNELNVGSLLGYVLKYFFFFTDACKSKKSASSRVP